MTPIAVVAARPQRIRLWGICRACLNVYCLMIPARGDGSLRVLVNHGRSYRDKRMLKCRGSRCAPYGDAWYAHPGTAFVVAKHLDPDAAEPSPFIQVRKEPLC